MKKTIFLTTVGLMVLFIVGCSVTAVHSLVKTEAPKEMAAEKQWFPKGEKGVYLVANTEVASMLNVSGEKIRITGRASFYLSGSESMIRKGTLHVNGFSLAFFGVPQQMLAGKIKTTTNSGVLGFAANTSKPQQLKYDAKTGRITGDIGGYIDAAYMSALIKVPVKDDKMGPFETVTQPATLTLDMKITKPLKGDIEKVIYDKSQLSIKLNADSVKYDRYEIAPIELSVEQMQVPDITIGSWWWFEVAKRLSIQPVRIGRFKVIYQDPWGPILLTFEMTGDGLAFGKPGARAEWAKCDVVFNYRDWKTLWKPSFWEVDTNGMFTSAEQSNLLDEVDDDDCIEVYFIDEFNPVSWGGGGATWGSGTAGSKIITSEANTRGGIDFNHLAHELGHVMGLLHPGDPASADAVPASTGTLMCGSGFLNDNPSVNSQ